MGEVLMFVRENIAQLVGQALGVAYPGIDVGVRMSVYPIVYAAIGDIVLQLYGERHVCLAALKLWVEHTERQIFTSLCCCSTMLSVKIAGSVFYMLSHR